MRTCVLPVLPGSAQSAYRVAVRCVTPLSSVPERLRESSVWLMTQRAPLRWAAGFHASMKAAAALQSAGIASRRVRSFCLRVCGYAPSAAWRLLFVRCYADANRSHALSRRVRQNLRDRIWVVKRIRTGVIVVPRAVVWARSFRFCEETAELIAMWPSMHCMMRHVLRMRRLWAGIQWWL
jgi:hypothetical protein